MRAIRVGLVGFGYWGEKLARNIARNDILSLEAVADSDRSSLNKASLLYPGVQVFDDPLVMLKDRQIDAIVLASPAESHVRIGMAALEYDKDLFVEKPLALDLASARDLVTRASELSRVLMVGHTFLYSSSVAYLKGHIESGELGEVRLINSQRLLGQARTDCDVLWDLAPHDVSIILHLLGNLPLEVKGHAQRNLRQQHADTFFGHLMFADGANANIHVGWVNPAKVRLLAVIGTCQMALYDDIPVDRNVTISNSGIDGAAIERAGSDSDLDRRTGSSDLLIPRLATTEPLFSELEDFANACIMRESPMSSAEFGLQVTAVLEALHRSSLRDGERVKVEIV